VGNVEDEIVDEGMCKTAHEGKMRLHSLVTVRPVTASASPVHPIFVRQYFNTP
jgi:hypothetical protein